MMMATLALHSCYIINWYKYHNSPHTHILLPKPKDKHHHGPSHNDSHSYSDESLILPSLFSFFVWG